MRRRFLEMDGNYVGAIFFVDRALEHMRPIVGSGVQLERSQHFQSSSGFFGTRGLVVEASASLPEVRLGEINQIVAAAAHHRLEHVEREALRHLDRDAGWNGKHHPAHDRVDQNRSVVRERFRDAMLDVARILEADPAHADRLRHRREIRILELVPKSRNPDDFCSISMKPSAPLLNTTTFTGRLCWTRVRKSPISMVKPPSPDSEVTCRRGNAAWAPIACDIALAMEPCQNDTIGRRLPFIAR